MCSVQDLIEGWAAEVDRLMKEQGMNNAELASRCDVHESTISRIRRGLANPNDELKWKIAGALGERMDVVWAWPRVVPPRAS